MQLRAVDTDRQAGDARAERERRERASDGGDGGRTDRNYYCKLVDFFDKKEVPKRSMYDLIASCVWIGVILDWVRGTFRSD